MSEQYAFPGYLHTRLENGEMHAESFPGLTKRELFAAMAMAHIATATCDYRFPADDIAKIAIRHADALIAELNGEKP